MNDFTQAELSTILCRPLTDCEQQNFEFLISVIKSEIISELCWNPFEPQVTEKREFTYEDTNYVRLSPFTGLLSVSIKDCASETAQDITCDWKPYTSELQPTNSCATVLRRCKCNECEIVCGCYECKLLVVEATWNCDIPEIKMLLAKWFENDAAKCDAEVQSKSLRSFSVTYREKTQFVDSDLYKRVIAKWKLCGQPDTGSY